MQGLDLVIRGEEKQDGKWWVFEDTAKEATDADTYTSSDEERKSREFNEAGGKEQMNPEDYYNPYENQAMSLMRNRRYNIEPELEANRLAESNYYRALRQGAPSQGRYLAGLQAGQIGKQRGDAEAYARKQNMENQYLGEEAGMLGGFGQQRASTKFQVEDINARNRAFQKGYIPTALSQLQQQTQVNRIMREKQRLMKNKALRDDERQRIMEEYFKGYNFNLGGD